MAHVAFWPIFIYQRHNHDTCVVSPLIICDCSGAGYHRILPTRIPMCFADGPILYGVRRHPASLGMVRSRTNGWMQSGSSDRAAFSPDLPITPERPIHVWCPCGVRDFRSRALPDASLVSSRSGVSSCRFFGSAGVQQIMHVCGIARAATQ